MNLYYVGLVTIIQIYNKVTKSNLKKLLLQQLSSGKTSVALACKCWPPRFLYGYVQLADNKAWNKDENLQFTTEIIIRQLSTSYFISHNCGRTVV